MTKVINIGSDFFFINFCVYLQVSWEFSILKVLEGT